MKPIPYGRQNITEEDIRVVVETLKSDYLTQGPKISEFETKFSDYCNANYCSIVSNGTAALHLCALALGVKPGDRIITTPITFVASANGFRYCGAEIDFCDIDEITYTLDLEKLEEKLSLKPKGYYKGVVVVDFAGYPVNMEKLRKIADKFDLWIVEDACHSPGGYFIDSKGEKQLCGNGKYSDLTVFSFHPVKHIATGEGGAITTNNIELHKKVQLYRTHGITKEAELLNENHGGWYYEMQELGFNYRITDFQAALGISQLSRADEGIKRRNEIAEKYNEAFSKIEKIKTPYVEDNIFHAYHLYVIQVEDRLGLYNYLRSKNIFAQVHYVPIHLMPYYKQFGWKEGDLPFAENYYKHCLSLPMYPTLSDQDQEYVINVIKDYLLK